METKKSASAIFKIAKYTGITLALLLSFLFTAPYIFADEIKEQIKKAANQRLDAKLNYSDVSVSFFEHFPSLTLTLDNLNLNGSVPFEKEKLIISKEVSFGISVPALLFSKTVKIDEIYLSNATVNVKVNEKGEANYNIYKASKKEADSKNEEKDNSLKLEKIEIINSKIIYNDQSTKMQFDAQGFNYVGKGDLSNAVFDLYSKAKIKKLNIVYENEPYLMNKKIDADLITKININSLSFLFEQNNLKINQLLVDFKGKFEILKEGYNLDFNIESNNSNLYDVFTAFPPNYTKWLSKTELNGKTDFLLTLQGKYIASQNIAPDFNLDLKIKDGFVNYNKSNFPVSKLDLNIKTSIPSLDPKKAIVDAQKLNLNVAQDYIKSTFYLRGIENPDLKLKLFSNVDLENLSQALGIPDIILKGKLISNIESNGIFNKTKKLFPVTDGTISITNGFIKTKYYPNPISNISIDAKLQNQKGTFEDLAVNLKPVKFTFENNPFILNAAITNFEDLNYDITAKGVLDIARIYKVFSTDGLDLDGYLKADLTLKGKQSDVEKGHYNKLNNKGVLELKNIGIASTYLPKKFIIKHGVFKINQDKMTFKDFLASYGTSDFRMNGYMQNVFNYATSNKGILKGNFVLNSDYLNLDEFMSETPVKNSTNTEKNNNNQIAPIATANTGVILIPKNLNLKISTHVKKTNFNGVTFNNTSGTTKLSNGRIQLQDANLNIIGSTIAVNAYYEPKNTKSARFTVSLKTTDFDIKKAYNQIPLFRDMASAAEKAEGIVSLDYQLKGRINERMEPVYPSLQGNGVLSIKDVKVRGLKMFNAVSSKTNKDALKNPDLSQVDIKSNIKNNIITLERFKFKFAGFRPRIEGTSSFDGKLNLKMRLGLPPLGILGIPLTITGTKDNPKVKINKKTETLQETEDTEI